MQIETVLIDLTALGVVLFSWRCLPAGRLRWLFIAFFLLFSAYKIYDPASEWRGLLWLRHLPVYLGELLFYYFISIFSKRYIETDGQTRKPADVVLRQNFVVLAPIIIAATEVSWFQIVTDQGLPHILTLPVIVLVVSLARLRLAVYTSSYTRIVALFTVSVGAWIMIHVSEFIVESQKLLPGLDNYMAHIEFFWYIVGAGLFVYTLQTFKSMTHETPIK